MSAGNTLSCEKCQACLEAPDKLVSFALDGSYSREILVGLLVPQPGVFSVFMVLHVRSGHINILDGRG